MAGLTALALMYPSAPQMLDFSKLPLVNPRAWRMLQFGPYLFPGTFQERNRESKLALIKKKLPFTPGDFNPGNTSMAGRTLEFYGTIGPGVPGFMGNLLETQTDIENEREMLAGLQDLGRQSLYVGPDRFIWAYLEDFTFSYQDGTGYRVADWTAKFYCDDPRYYGSSSGSLNNGKYGPGTQGLPNMNVVTYVGTTTGVNTHSLNQNGNTKAWPVWVFTVLNGTVTAPQFLMCTDSAHTSNGIGITFSKFNTANPMNAGDQLILMCDPRPEYSMIAATYYPGGGWPTPNVTPVNALGFVTPFTDFNNAIDFQYWLPWISSQTVDDLSGGLNTNGVGVATGSSGFSYELQFMWWDTYL